jgi:catechol 2,3-dioxygenase-like lactoylglutathione lyase family enzyme
MYLSYFGLRVRDPVRSTQFYSDVFGLVRVHPTEWPPTDLSGPVTVLLRDPLSGQRLELNYYPEGNPYAIPYLPGEELDHLGIRVDRLSTTLQKLEAWGIRPEAMKHFAGPIMDAPSIRMAYVRDPDGVQLELFETPPGEPSEYDPHRY